MSNLPVIGAFIGVSFAFGWAVAGSLQFASPLWRGLALGTSLLISLLLAAALLRHARQTPSVTTNGSFNRFSYALAVAFEFLAMPLAVAACRRYSRPDLILPAVAGIVGLHFFGLAHALGKGGSVFVWVGSAMIALALVAFCGSSPANANQWAAAVGLGCACILWASACRVLR